MNEPTDKDKNIKQPDDTGADDTEETWDDLFTAQLEPDESELEPPKEPEPITPPEPSELDMLKERYQALENQSSQMKTEYEQFRNLRDTLIANPEALQAVQRALMGQAVPTETQPPVEEPVPQRPKDYDPVEAISTPGSLSWNYREELESFKERKRVKEYEAKLEQERNKLLSEIDNKLAQERRQTHLDSLQNQFLTTHPEAVQKWTEFQSWMGNPRGVTLEHFWNLYQQIQNPGNDKPVPGNDGLATKVAQTKRVIPSVTEAGGESEQVLSEEDKFSQDWENAIRRSPKY